MTSLQIDYWKFEEQKRTNQANEGLRASELKETTRHNMASEAIGWAQVGELARHNKATEEIQQFSAETGRMQAETSQLHETNWREVQDQQIALQKDANEIAAERNRLQGLDVALGFEKLDFQKETWAPEMNVRLQQLDQEQQRIDITRSDNTRKWIDSIIGDIGGLSHGVTSVASAWTTLKGLAG